MPAILISLLSKLGPYVAVAQLALGLGFYGGYHWCLPQVLSAQLALKSQVAADAQATAAANAKAAAFQAQLGDLQNQMQAARLAGQQAAAAAGVAEEATIAHQAVTPGQDAPVAPVLSLAHQYLAGEGTP